MIELKNPLKGEINGYKFSVKPKSLLARKAKKELQEALENWQKSNNKEYTEYIEKHSEEVKQALENKDFNAEVFQNCPESNDWMDDAEFRANRWKTMADYCMDFAKEPPASLWESDEIEYGMVELAWDFFTGKREVPMDMLIR